MTTVDIVLAYAGHPNEATMRAINTVHEVYGIRRIVFDEKARQVRVEYDATRLNAAVVESLLRRAGLKVSAKA